MDADLPAEPDRAELRRLAEAAAKDPQGRTSDGLAYTNWARFHTMPDLAARVVKLVDDLDAAEARIKRLEAALELFRSEYCVYDGTDRQPNLGMVAAAVHAALAGEEKP